MRRGIFDVLKRGFDNTIANWQLILVRFGEMVFFAILAVLTLIAVIVPVLVSVGIHIMELRTADDLEGAMEALLRGWIVLVWIAVAFLVLTIVWVAIHSFVEAGCARIYVDGERVAGPAMNGPRQRYAVFSLERWLSGGKDGWWAVFWIYNLAWGVAGLILLIPLIPTLGLMLYIGDAEPRASIAIGCVGLVLTLLLGILVAVVTGMCTTRAIADWAGQRQGARAALGRAWHAIKSDLGRHLVVVVAVIVVAMAGSSVFASFSMLAAFGDIFSRHSAYWVTWPVRGVGQVLNLIFSSAVTSWYLASYAALSVEDRS